MSNPSCCPSEIQQRLSAGALNAWLGQGQTEGEYVMICCLWWGNWSLWIFQCRMENLASLLYRNILLSCSHNFWFLATALFQINSLLICAGSSWSPERRFTMQIRREKYQKEVKKKKKGWFLKCKMLFSYKRSYTGLKLLNRWKSSTSWPTPELYIINHILQIQGAANDAEQHNGLSASPQLLVSLQNLK